MKKLLILLALLTAVPVYAKNYSGTGSNSKNHYVHGYAKKNGTYVQPHHSTNPNRTQRDNYNARGNQNPHNGQTGKNYVDR